MDQPHLVFLVAMEYEISSIFDTSKFSLSKETVFNTYHHNKKNISIIETGIGKVNAAAAAGYALSLKASKYINIGLAGSFNNDVKIGSVFSINKCKFWDIDVTVFNYEIGQIPQNGLVNYQLDNSDLLDLKKTNLLSGDSFVSDTSKISKLAKSFKAELLEMEATSLAHIFHLHKKLSKLTSLKIVSDYLNANSANKLYSDKENMFNKAKKIISKLIKEY